eukprot:scaffold25771_cov62-Phaeocystis_antarctica.AAC.1
MYVKRETGWRWGFASVRSCVRQSAARGRTHSERGRSTTTHGRSRRGGAGGTRRARAEQTEGTLNVLQSFQIEGTFLRNIYHYNQLNRCLRQQRQSYSSETCHLTRTRR